MTDMTPDEVRARAIIDDYVHAVTGMTPGDRGLTHFTRTFSLLGERIRKAFETAFPSPNDLGGYDLGGTS